MGKRFLLILLGLSVAGLITSCSPNDPKLNSVKAAHGNTDWHIDTAEEFLTGKEMGGTMSAANHVPDSWTRTHIHVGMTDTNSYYTDRDVMAGGQDDDSGNGIDKPMLFFYAGHGSPTSFDTLGNSAALTQMRIGNRQDSNKGTLRYYWQCSCEVFAHGPQSCTGVNRDYACPEDFDGSADSIAMRNVYERWGSSIDPRLRMACGSSTLAYCHETETNGIWDNYNNKGYDVADSFIDGLHRYPWNTPLCITTGDHLVSGTPLFDATFTNAANSSGPYFHIQYLTNFDTSPPALMPVKLPELLPIYDLLPLPLPAAYGTMQFEKEGEWLYSTEKVEGRGAAVRIHGYSGAVYAFGAREFDETALPLAEKEYVEVAKRLIHEHGWTEKDVSEPAGQKMIIESVPREGEKREIQRTQKNVILTLKRRFFVDRKVIRSVGEGGIISIQLNRDGTLFNAAKIWRTIKGVQRTTRSKGYREAYQEAATRIKEKDAYKLTDWTWGYEEAAGNVKQTELKAIHIFNFMPADPDAFRAYPPRIEKVSAHLD